MEFVVLLIMTAVIAVMGIRIGMLVAPRIDRWGTPRDPEDEEDRPA
jgi:hypothetical protein